MITEKQIVWLNSYRELFDLPEPIVKITERIIEKSNELGCKISSIIMISRSKIKKDSGIKHQCALWESETLINELLEKTKKAL